MNNKRFEILVGLLLFSSIGALSTAAAEESELRDLSGFNSVSVGGGIDLRLRQANDFSVEVFADDGDTDEIVTEIDNGTLRIYEPESIARFFDWSSDYSASISLPELESLKASGGSDVSADGRFSGDRLTIEISGGSDTTIEVDVDALEIRASGGSDVRISGSARAADFVTSGGSDLSARDLEIGEATVRSSGGSDMSITVLERLVGSASGRSDIAYHGDPEIVDVNTSGARDIRRR